MLITNINVLSGISHSATIIIPDPHSSQISLIHNTHILAVILTNTNTLKPLSYSRRKPIIHAVCIATNLHARSLVENEEKTRGSEFIIIGRPTPIKRRLGVLLQTEESLNKHRRMI